MNKPVKHFDLPKHHLTGNHYVPARARQTDEIDRRRSLRRGTLLLEQQRDGLAIMSHIVERVEDDNDLLYVSDILAASALNTSWYGFAQHAPGMRRRLHLPQLVNEETDWHETRSGLLTKVRSGLAEAVEHASMVTAARAGGYETTRHTFGLGRHIGNNALKTACVTLGNATYGMSPYDVQLAARDQSLAMLERSRVLSGKVGTNVSLAQLPDPDSPFSVHIRRTAPDTVFNAFEEAVEEIRYVA